MFVSRFKGLYERVIILISGGMGDWVYRFLLFGLLLCFVSLRMPYLYGMSGFGVFILFCVLPLFSALFVSRLLDGSVDNFFGGFIPLGTPLWIAPFVCLAETLSYLVRPGVLMIRPFVNLSIGALGGVVLGGMCFSSIWVLVFLLILFFYEVFVAMVHWFIICSILSFSEDH